MIELRPYQERGVSEIRASYEAGCRRVLHVSPTGSGKTIQFIFIVTNAVARGNRVLILVHRQELIDQVAAALEHENIMYGVIAGGYQERPLSKVQIASVAALSQRLYRYADGFDLVIVDEAHHAIARSYRRVIDAMPKAKVLGVTATPQRADGRGLGSVFDHMVLGPDVAELIDAGYLSKYRVFVPAQSVNLSKVKLRAGDYALEELAAVMGAERLTDDVIGDYARICARAPAVAFCCDVGHSMAVARRFQQQGFRAAHVDGGTERGERRRLIAGLGNGQLDVLTNCGIVAEGLDVPAIGAAILLRPTRSLALHLQQIGRALRPAPGKDRALILDFAGNVPTLGFPDEPRAWSLVGSKVSSTAGRALTSCRCPECGTLNPMGTAQCDACGTRLQQVPPPAAPPRVVSHGALATMPYRTALEWAGSSIGRLKMVAAARGYKPGWVWMQARALREGKRGTAA